jgi:hypothetical protein
MKNTGEEGILKTMKEYLNIRVELAQLKTVEVVSGAVSNYVSWVLVLITLLFAGLFLAITFGIYLSQATESYIKGFGMVGLIFIFKFLVLFLFRERLITPSLRRMIIKQLTSKKNDQ